MTFKHFFQDYWWQLILVAAISYLIGCVNYAVVFSKAIKHEDIRSLGSKNAGTTNMFRVFGLRMGALTFLCDALKGVVPSLVCRFLFADADVALTFAYWAGLFAVIGHIFPVFYNWWGGKGVATSIGVCFVVQPLLSLYCVLPLFLLVFVVDRMSVMSLTLATFMIVWHWAVLAESVGVVACTFVTVMFALVILAHRGNIMRIVTGKEPKTGLRRKLLRIDKREAKARLQEEQNSEKDK